MKHIVAIKLKDNTESIRQTIIEGFNKLKVEIKEIKTIEYQYNVYLKREENFDIQVCVEFKGINELETYLNHESHIKFGKEILKPNAVKIGTFDYE